MPKSMLIALAVGAAVSTVAFFFKRSMFKFALIGTAAAAGFMWWKGRK